MDNNNNKQTKIEDLFEELKRQMNNSYDMVVPSERIIAMKKDNKLCINVALTDEERQRLDKPDYEPDHFVNEWAKNQIGQKTGIPMKYFHKMEDNEKIDLLANNINEWLPDKDTRMVRVLDGKVRALLSSRYNPINNYDVLFMTLQEIIKLRQQGMLIDVIDARVSETKMYLKFTSPDLTADIQKFRNISQPEAVQGGIIISNSEVGNGAFTVQPFMNVLVCTNGLISPHSLRKIHVGQERDIGVIDWSSKTKEMGDKLLFSQMKDMVQQTFDEKIFNKWVDEINAVASIDVPKPSIAIENLCKTYKLSKGHEHAILDEFIGNAPNTGRTQWGIGMAVTRVAQDVTNYDDRIDLEEIGAKLLTPGATNLLTS